MEKIIGIDLGTNSIGWAIRDTSEAENQIIDKGVLTFDKGVAEDKSGEHPMVQKRTESRGKRRNYQAEKYRKWELLECLINKEMCPLTIADLNEWRHYKKGVSRKYPQSEKFIQWLRFDFDGNGKPDFEKYGLSKNDNCYAFRWLAISEKEEHKKIFETNKALLGRVLYQLVQRRGYKSSSIDDPETKLIEEGRSNPQDKTKLEVVGIKVIDNLINKKYKTLGATLYWGQKNNELESVNHNRIRNRFTYRHHFETEIDTIFTNLNYDLESDFCKKVKKSIIWQRPLRSQKGLVGYCTLDRPLKSKTGIYYKAGKKRIPVSHPLYEEFRTWVDINNLKIEPPIEIDKLKFIEQVVFPMFNKATDFYFSEKKDKNGKVTDKGLKLRIESEGGKVLSNFDVDLDEENEGKKYKANIFLNKIEKIFGDDWKELLRWNETLSGVNKTGNYLRVEDIWHLVYDATITKNQTDKLGERLVPILQKHFSTIEFDIKDFDNIRLTKGYASLSAASVKTILPYLKQGMLYSHAVFVANLEKVFNEIIEQQRLSEITKDYEDLLNEHKANKEIYGIVNNLISDRLNERDRLSMGNDYILDEYDIRDINDKIKDGFKTKIWNKKSKQKQVEFIEKVKEIYGAFLRQPLGMDKSKQFYKIYRIDDKIIELLTTKYKADKKRIENYLWHPSEQEIYSPAYIKADNDGVVITDNEGNEIFFLGDPNPISRGFKNPMAMKTLQYLKKLLNYLLEARKIDSYTKVVVEIARELNDTNTRKAIKKYQDERGKARNGYKKILNEYFDEQGNSNKSISDELIDRYELWQEQSQKCLYCEKNIECTDILNGTAQVEHTIPESISRCSELYNLTIAHYDCNAKKAKRFPTQWSENYDLIKDNVRFIYAKFKDFEDKYEQTFQRAKSATTKDKKDQAIQDRHYYKMHLIYWRKKYETFTIEEVTNQFRRQQLTDTQVITKYALPYLKIVFKKVDVQKGIDTALFRKIYKIQPKLETKDRSKHSHHAVDAAVLTLIPPSNIKEFLRKEYHTAHENNILNSFNHPNPRNWENYRPEYIHEIENNVTINFQPHFRTQTQSVKYQRKRGNKVPLVIDKQIVYKRDEKGDIQYKKNKKGEFEYKRNRLGELIENEEGNLVPIPLKEFKKAKGETIRGQLHKESVFGAILKPRYDENEKAINVGGKFLHEEKVSFVKRVHLEVNTLRGFKFDKKEKEIPKFLKQFDDIIDPQVRRIVLSNIKERLANNINPDEVLNEPIFMLNKEGKKVHQIRRVRVYQGNINPPEIKKIEGIEGLYLSKHKHKQFTYAENTDYVSMACYKGFDGNEKEVFHFKPLTALNIAKEKTIPIFENQNGISYKLIWEIKPGMKILLIRNENENFAELTDIEKKKRIYLVNNVYPAYQGEYEFFYANVNYHLSVVSTSIKLPKRKKEINFDNPLVSPLVRLNLNPKKSLFAIEGKDFEMKSDGQINWLQ
jgi:CRISPR-associated endonuclease Csn1